MVLMPGTTQDHTGGKPDGCLCKYINLVMKYIATTDSRYTAKIIKKVVIIVFNLSLEIKGARRQDKRAYHYLPEVGVLYST